MRCFSIHFNGLNLFYNMIELIELERKERKLLIKNEKNVRPALPCREPPTLSNH